MMMSNGALTALNFTAGRTLVSMPVGSAPVRLPNETLIVLKWTVRGGTLMRVPIRTLGTLSLRMNTGAPLSRGSYWTLRINNIPNNETTQVTYLTLLVVYLGKDFNRNSFIHSGKPSPSP